mgnify:CR=1 FL=1
MGDKTKIQWTDATWNPLRGCARVSDGCRNCYAESVAHRFGGPGMPYEGLTRIVNGRPTWTGEIRLVPELLDQPLRWNRSDRRRMPRRELAGRAQGRVAAPAVRAALRAAARPDSTVARRVSAACRRGFAAWAEST